jgi:hypothetical protein
MAARANRTASAISIGLLLAEQKMEELRSTPAGLAPSPADAIFVAAVGHVDYFDASGVLVGDPSPAATPPPTGAVYVRRWSVEPLPGGATGMLLLQVRVMPRGAAGRSRERGEVRLHGLRGQGG